MIQSGLPDQWWDWAMECRCYLRNVQRQHGRWQDSVWEIIWCRQPVQAPRNRTRGKAVFSICRRRSLKLFDLSETSRGEMPSQLKDCAR